MSSEEQLVLSNFIGGAFVAPEEGKYLDIHEPATGQVYGQLPASSAVDAEAAVAAAQSAFPGWSGLTADERSRVLLRVADLIEERLDAFAAAESRDNGKPVSLARAVDIPRAVWNFRFFATAILHHCEQSTVIDPCVAVNYTTSEPYGVCCLISPWNLPIYLLSWKIAPCIAVGNTCVCKPSEFTSVSAWMLCEVLNEAGVPAGVVNMVFGVGPDAAAPLVAHPEVPLVSFTGGTVTGEIVQKTAAPHHKELSLELGGKNANIVFADADLEEAIPGSVKAAFANQGQICLCGSRLFVHEDIYETFVERFVAAVDALVVGDPTDAATNMGALVSAPHRAKVLSYIRLAEEEGGTIVAGGAAPPELPEHLAGGYYVRPTVVTGLDASARCNTEEIFGPVVCVIPFADEDEVVAAANSVRYGLAASVWTADVKRAHRVAHRLHAGTVWVNCWLVRDLRVPFGGFKHSGSGREGGEYSIDMYTQTKNICVKL